MWNGSEFMHHKYAWRMATQNAAMTNTNGTMTISCVRTLPVLDRVHPFKAACILIHSDRKGNTNVQYFRGISYNNPAGWTRGITPAHEYQHVIHTNKTWIPAHVIWITMLCLQGLQTMVPPNLDSDCVGSQSWTVTVTSCIKNKL